MTKPSYSFDTVQSSVSQKSTQDTSYASAYQTTGAPTPVNPYIIDEPKESGGTSRIGGAATMVVGGAIALVGVPMLILPGPGLLAIGGGAALMYKGAKSLFGKKK